MKEKIPPPLCRQFFFCHCVRVAMRSGATVCHPLHTHTLLYASNWLHWFTQKGKIRLRPPRAFPHSACYSSLAMQAGVPPCWNRLSQEVNATQPAVCHLITNSQRNELVHDDPDTAITCSKKVHEDVTLSKWEIEAVRRYNTLKNGGLADLSAEKHFKATLPHNVLLHLIIHSKLLRTTDWSERAHIAASWFTGPTPVSIELLPHAVVQLITSHQLTPCIAAKFLVDISKTVMSSRVQQHTGVTVRCMGVRAFFFTAEDWRVAEVLRCAVYTLQGSGQALFECFSSFFLRAGTEDILTIAGDRELSILPLCFLVKRCKDFSQDARMGEEVQQQRQHLLQRACQLAVGLPTHLATILGSVL